MAYRVIQWATGTVGIHADRAFDIASGTIPAGGISGMRFEIRGRTRLTRRPACMYSACMPNVQVRDLPEDVHAALVRRAEQAGQSLQQFLTMQLTEIASTPTMQEILDRIEQRPKGALSAEEAIEALDEERARR